MSARRSTGALAAGVLLALLPAPPSRALEATSTAGTLDGETVSLGEVDEVLQGAIRQRWKEIDGIFRTAARALCLEHAVEQAVHRDAGGVPPWRERIWVHARPMDAAVEQWRSDHILPSGGRPERAEVRHRLHVESYRRGVEEAAQKLLGGGFRLHLDDPPERPDAEPRIPAVVATCPGREITREEVEEFASFPLFRRRAEIVTAACRELDPDYSNPLLLRRIAGRRGLTIEALLRSVEQGESPSDARVESAARERYGDTDSLSLFKSRLALDVRRRVEQRMAFLERIRHQARAECRLHLPPPPAVRVRGRGPSLGPPDALRVVYFGGLRCRHCAEGWETLMQLRRRWGDRIRLEFRHHFPEGSARPFRDALEAACSARQDRFWEYLAWRFSGGAAEEPAPGALAEWLGMEVPSFRHCLGEPGMAVRILGDTEEALRIGFRGAVPSWVIGRRPRRGFQGEDILDRTIAGEAAGGAWEHPRSSPETGRER